MPIVAGYIIAHYLTLFVDVGTQTLARASDPLGKGWDIFGTAGVEPSYWFSYHPTVLATVKVLAVVIGHVTAAVVAHDRAIALLPRKHQVTGQLPLLVAMVTFTAGGLYLLVQTPDAGHLVDQPGHGAGQRRLTGLDEGAAGDQGPVDRRLVVGQEVHADVAPEAGEHRHHVGLPPAEGGAHPVDHQSQDGAGSTSCASATARASRASPTGSAEPTSRISSAASSASTVSPLRSGRTPTSATGSCSRLKPVSSTT